MTIDLGKLDGLKTYISIFLYVIYNAAVAHQWLAPNHDIELFLQGAIAANFVHKVSKLNTGTSVPIKEIENGK